MRRKDREITDPAAIREIIQQCEVLRIGLHDPDDPLYPYIVPLNFGFDDTNGQMRFYVHGARAGRKFQLMRSGTVCAFQMDCGATLALDHNEHEATTHYRCVMGRASIRLLEQPDDIVRGLERLMDRRADTRAFPWSRVSLPHTAVWELTVTELTAKANPPIPSR